MRIRTRARAGAPRTGSRSAGALLAGAAALSAAVGPAAPAGAHPFGPPSTAGVSVDGARVALVWQAAEDDWVALGQSVGAFEDPTAGAVDTALTGEQKLQRSAAVREYLLRHVDVRQAGRTCAEELLPLERLLAEGARFRFDCPEPVTEVRLTVTALTDLNPAYRTMVTARTPMAPAQALFTATGTSHDLRATATGGGRPGAVTAVAAGTGLAAAGGLAVLLVRRRRAGGRR
ncbi:hypothetical protein C5N14_21155 [Micromonospora sp. MW-13]|uniref:hypothetical protein n=1 Tax=unclassified Micromonospora TaxID=2617518 RepID=UPI000E42DAD6|nr:MULTISPECIES: hypothetical protein [unclassified Micromonospora]MCX4471764.1 hypothetical protein [Micromonospora sp. NBC_01655]RGC66966.1 hypothetical protein C5N14_21155 [Micromonospora sp. MW-13]